MNLYHDLRSPSLTFRSNVHSPHSQLCINFANEKLQALFTKSVFEETLKAYKDDGISADEITYVDNKHLIAIFDKPQAGLWGLLSEECMVPKGSDTGFTEKLHDAQAKGSALAAVKGVSRAQGFQMAHFAGQVTYTTNLWLDKNKDPLNGTRLPVCTRPVSHPPSLHLRGFLTILCCLRWRLRRAQVTW